MVVSPIPPQTNVYKHVLLGTTETQLVFVWTIAAPTAEGLITSLGIVRPNARVELGAQDSCVSTSVLHCLMVILWIGIAIRSLIDQILRFLLIIILKHGWPFVHFLHWLLVTEPRSNVSQPVLLENSPTPHQDSAKQPAPTHHTSQTQPLENAFSSAQQVSLPTQTTTNAKTSVQAVNSPILQQTNVSVHVLPHITGTTMVLAH